MARTINLAALRRSPLVQDTVKVSRRCLRCGRKFPSRGIGNRLCPVCGGYGKRSLTPAGATGD